MNRKIIQILVMIFLLCSACISCNQKIPTITNNIGDSSTQTTLAPLETFSYYRISSIEGIQYEIPTDWETSEKNGTTYHYYNNETYLMVSSITTDFTQNTENIDKTLTDNCSDTLLKNLNDYNNFFLETDCTGFVDGAYCRKIVCSYLDDNNTPIIERTTIFTVNGIVYSFDSISFGNFQKNNECFRRILGSVIISPTDF